MDVKTASRTIELFEVFSRLRRPASLTELAAQMEIPVSSCFALTKTLEKQGYLYTTRDRGPLYPTGRLARLSALIGEGDPLTTRVLDTLTALREEFDETAVAGILRGPQVVYLHVAETDRPVRYAPRMGDTRPAHANSIGKAILGEMPVAQREATLAKLDYRRFTEKTLTSREALERDLREGRERGWYCNFGESVDDLAAIACAIEVNGFLVGLSVAGPSYRMKALPPDRVGARLKAISSTGAAEG